ncbi:MAG: 3-oxoacyl-[acyl-carrier-protein] reductase [Acidobacteriota bacterium]
MSRDGELSGRISLVTGASRGIGHAIARRLARDGATVVCVARNAERLEEAVASLRKDGLTAEALPLDIRDEDAVRSGVEQTLARHTRIDHLINNAGITRDGLLLRMKTEDWKTVLETNLTGMFFLTRAVLSAMVRARSGRIVNLSSVVARSGNPGQSNYCASKAAIEGFTRSLALEIASRGITVNAVAPGFINTDMTAGLDDKARQAMTGRIPLRRLGEPDDVAGAVRFLVGKEASYITGTTLNVNGGMHL